MTPTRPAVSLGPLVLILALALPAGLFSAMSLATTGELVDAADTIVLARVASLQRLASSSSQFGDDPAGSLASSGSAGASGFDRFVVELDVQRSLLGTADLGRLVIDVGGGAPLHAGDLAVAMLTSASLGSGPLASGSVEALGWLPVAKEAGVLTITGPVTGMAAQGLPPSGPIALDDFALAVSLRRGLVAELVAGVPAGGMQFASAPPPSVTGLVDDGYEPNDTLGTGSPIVPAALNGKLLITGLNLTRDDVDYFTFTETLPLIKFIAETIDPPPGGANTDTIAGVFNATSGNLLGFNDDINLTAGNYFSRVEVPLEAGGDFAVAVSPWADFEFDGGGFDISLGPYDLSLQRVLGSYLWNGVDLMAGFSPDGTFIQDAMGFRAIGGPDVLLAGLPADGWGLQYMVERSPSGVTALVFGGAGEQLGAPGYTHPLIQRVFKIGSYSDAFGTVRQSLGESQVAFSHTGSALDGVGVEHDYRWSKGSATLKGDLTLIVPIHKDITDVLYERVLDLDLFDASLNEFSWSFNPLSTVQAFAVDTSTVVGGLSLPGSSTGGPVSGDMQAALRIAHGSGGIPFDARTYRTPYPMAFTFVRGEASASAAHDEALDNLANCRMETWVIAVGQDPDDGTWAAFGVGLSEP